MHLVHTDKSLELDTDAVMPISQTYLDINYAMPIPQTTLYQGLCLELSSPFTMYSMYQVSDVV